MPYWVQLVIFAVISGLIQYIIVYSKEKGKNLATKEDIEEITKKIESVKQSYNESLEKHKIELQKDFESYKYIFNLCKSIDNQLLSHVSNCLKANASKGIIYPDNDNKLLAANAALSRFMNTYESRYKENTLLNKLTGISSTIDADYQLGDLYRRQVDNDEYYLIGNERKGLLIELLNETLILFLPPFNVENPEQ